MAGAIRRALAEREGGLLAFLPGVAEIARTAEALGQAGDPRLLKDNWVRVEGGTFLT